MEIQRFILRQNNIQKTYLRMLGISNFWLKQTYNKANFNKRENDYLNTAVADPHVTHCWPISSKGVEVFHGALMRPTDDHEFLHGAVFTLPNKK